MDLMIGLANVDFDHLDLVLEQVTDARIELLVLPENFSLEPEPLGGSVMRHMAKVAAELNTWVVYACRETNPTGDLPYNVGIVLDNKGNLRASYRKCHLYDAHGERESDLMTAGSALMPPTQTPFGRLGLGICYDLRFPEVARAAAAEGCDLMLYPAAWHDGPQKLEHWKTLLRARAIENEMFVAGVCKAGERYVNRSYLVDPLGRIVAEGTEPLLTTRICMDDVAAARDAMPVLSHRRPDLY